jgi:hypothetical protein
VARQGVDTDDDPVGVRHQAIGAHVIDAQRGPAEQGPGGGIDEQDLVIGVLPGGRHDGPEERTAPGPSRGAAAVQQVRPDRVGQLEANRPVRGADGQPVRA